MANSSTFVVENVTDEAAAFTKWSLWTSIPLSALTGSALVLGALSKGAIVNFIHRVAPNRPINKNFLFNQVLQLPAFVIMTLMMLVSFVTTKPIQSLLGTFGTVAFWTSAVLHNASMNVGGSGIAFYRLVCIKDLGLALDTIRAKNLMEKIIKVEMAAKAVLVALAAWGATNSNEAMASNFSRGHSSVMESIINPIKNEDKYAFPSGLILACGNMLAEMICYIIIYYELAQNDEQIKESVSKETIQERRRRNIITLSTQVIGFGLEFACIFLAFIITSFQYGGQTAFFIVCSVNSSIISLLQVLSSGEMRNYYFC